MKSAPHRMSGRGAGETVELGEHRRSNNTTSDPAKTPSARFASVDVGTARQHTAKLTNEQRGAFWELYWFAFNRPDPLPDDDTLLAEIVEFTAESWASLRRKLELFGAFEAVDGGLYLRLAKQSYDYFIARREQGIRAGRASAAKRAAAQEAGDD